MHYRLAIFDFDGTLADSFPWFLETFNHVADRYRFRRIEPHEVEALRGCSARQMIDHLGVPMWKLPAIARHMRRLMSRDIDRITLFPGIDGLLRGLSRAGVRLAIVTSNSSGNVRRVLGAERAALIHHYGCGAALLGKRAKFRAVLRRSGIPAPEALAIGDELRDLQAAHAERIAFGAVSWGYTRPDAFPAHAPRRVFTSPEEVLEAFA